MAELLTVRDLDVIYPGRGGRKNSKSSALHAVKQVSLDIGPGETLSLVGQSGSGKSTVGRVVARLQKASAGKVSFAGDDIAKLRGSELKQFRREVQIVFQDPYESLDPRYTIGQSIEEPVRALTDMKKDQRRDRVLAALEQVDLAPTFASRYPHQLSGGQRQRAAIARAVVVQPKFMVLDEPVSMLDVSIQAGVLKLLKELQQETAMAYLFITHDLAVARYIGDRIAVMRAGEIVEVGTAAEVVDTPKHEYTQLLIASAPEIEGL